MFSLQAKRKKKDTCTVSDRLQTMKGPHRQWRQMVREVRSVVFGGFFMEIEAVSYMFELE